MHSGNEGLSRLSNIELAEAALNSQPDTFLIFEPDSGKAVYWNKAFRDISGYSDAEIARLPAPVSYYDSDDLERIKNNMQEHSAADVLDIEAHLVCKDGSRVHAEYRISSIADDENKSKYIVSVGRDITERKQAEELLAGSRDLMRYIIEHSNSAVAVHDRNLKYIYVSQRYLQEYNVKERDVIGKHHYEIFPDLPQKWKDVHQRVLAGETLSATEDSYEREDGTVDWTRWECRPWYESNGSIGGIIVYTEIITEQKQLEEARKREKYFSDSLVNTAQMIVTVLNPDATIRFINPYMEKLSGYKLAEVKGKDWFNTFLPSGDWSEIRQLFKKAISDISTRGNINPIITKDGKERMIEWYDKPLMDSDDKVVGLLAVGQDITERRDAEIKIKQSEERNNFAQAVGHVGTWDWNVITDELIWSDETYRIFGLTPGECVPNLELFMNFVHVDDRERVSHAIETALNHNQAYNLDCRIVRKDGSEGVANAQGEVVFDQDAKPLQMRGTFQEISERKKLEEQLAQSQKMEAVGTLVGGIAHDFNNMLAGITGHLYLAKEHASEMPEITTNLDKIEDISFRAADMIQQLLAFARKNIITMKHLTLNPFIKETLKLLRVSVPENVEMHWDICSDALHINGDSTQLHQVLLNLVNNAFDAVEGKDNPSISIRLEAWRPGEAFMDSHAYFTDRPYARLSVKDNGCGIPEQQLTRLFDPFFTTKELGKGTGLGLSMAYGAIKTHHGFVEVESVEGKGSTFHIYIPLLQAEEIGLPAKKEKKTARGHGELILLVDDESEVIKVGCKVLEVLGYRVLTANNGPEAIELFREHADEVAMCICDIVMPVMNGDKVAHAMRQIKPDIKIIFSTGYDKSSLASMENEIILRKPYRIEEISSLIRKQIDT